MFGNNPFNRGKDLKPSSPYHQLAEKDDIHIKKSHEGLFTKKAKEHGKSVQDYAKDVLDDPDASAATKKQANFARNAAKWNKEDVEAVDEGILGGAARLAGRGIVGAAKLAGKATVGAAKAGGSLVKKALFNKQGNFRGSTAGRADSAERKVASMDKKNKDRERLKAAQARLKQSKVKK